MYKKGRGAWRTHKDIIDAAEKHVVVGTVVPPALLMWPVQMNPWGNYGLGDCVTAEEAFAKATAVPQQFFSQKNVINWARAHGYAQGAALPAVMSTMQTDGFWTMGKQFNDGGYKYVDYMDQTTLIDAAATSGPVKLGVAADDLENIVTAGVSGWIGTLPRNENLDHCISLCGYGQLEALKGLFVNHGITVVSDLAQPTGMSYAVFTWDSIGILDEQSLLNITGEAWVRSPVTVVVE